MDTNWNISQSVMQGVISGPGTHFYSGLTQCDSSNKVRLPDICLYMVSFRMYKKKIKTSRGFLHLSSIIQ